MKLKNIAIILYLAFIAGSYFYVKSVIEGVPVSQKSEEETVVYYTKIKAGLTIEGPSIYKKYEQIVKSNDSVADFVLTIKENNKDFVYERTRYTYGNKFESVLGLPSNNDYEWRMFLNNEDVTLKMDDLTVSDGQVYSLRYVNTANLLKP